MTGTVSRRALRVLAAIAAASLMAACGGAGGPTGPIQPTPSGTTVNPPAIAREMRGMWIATVANIDWPSRAGLTADQQKAELTDLLDRAASLGLNAIMFHVRPAADAVYQSSMEPWASMLGGRQGADPGYDPLAFAVSEAHARGLELHAWINPFRAGTSKDSALLAPSHVFNTDRSLVRVYGTQLWLDPGEPAAQDRSLRVIADIVSRYDIDGLHADDYFYPYQENDASGRLIAFPDSATFAKSGSTLSRDDWRRANIDRFVQQMYDRVHALKPAVKVGISPFGIWRPGNPSGISGLDAYATIYADSRKWLQQGWVDYLAPQLYWAIAPPAQSFTALFAWWNQQNSAGRFVWPGLAAYRVADGTSSAFATSEIPTQIGVTRTGAAPGHILYNTTAVLKKNGGAVASSIASLYTDRALVPEFTWLTDATPATPTVAVSGATVSFMPSDGRAPRWWAVRARAGGIWSTRIVFGDRQSVTLATAPDQVALNAVSMAGRVSPAATWHTP